MPERKRRRQGGGRRRKVAAREQGSVSYRPYIERKIPYFEILDEEGLESIEKNADILLEEIGIEFRDFPRALDLFKNAGADIDGERVRFPQGLCRELIQSNAPSEYTQHARNPKKILLKFFELFLKKGGKFERKNIKDIQFDTERPIIVSEDERYNFDKIVIACGAFSKRLTDNLGEKIPLDTERGYHVHFKNCDHLLNRPVIFSNRGFGITPMEQGLRVVGTVEFGGLDNPLSKSRVKNLIDNAKYMLGDLPEHEDEWLGFRPTLPDFLPVMGPSKNHKNVFYCFGHHHLGWTLGPISGKIVSGMIAKENTNLNLDPYSSIRFN